MAPHSSTLVWKIPWMEEPGGPQSVGSLRVGRDWATPLSLFTFLHWRRQWQPTPVFLPGESQRRGSLVGCRLWGHTESDTTEVMQAAAAAVFHCIYVPHLLYPVYGHLGCSHVLAIVNSAAMNIGVHASFRIILSSLGPMQQPIPLTGMLTPIRWANGCLFHVIHVLTPKSPVKKTFPWLCVLKYPLVPP